MAYKGLMDNISSTMRTGLGAAALGFGFMSANVGYAKDPRTFSHKAEPKELIGEAPAPETTPMFMDREDTKLYCFGEQIPAPKGYLTALEIKCESKTDLYGTVEVNITDSSLSFVPTKYSEDDLLKRGKINLNNGEGSVQYLSTKANDNRRKVTFLAELDSNGTAKRGTIQLHGTQNNAPNCGPYDFSSDDGHLLVEFEECLDESKTLIYSAKLFHSGKDDVVLEKSMILQDVPVPPILGLNTQDLETGRYDLLVSVTDRFGKVTNFESELYRHKKQGSPSIKPGFSRDDSKHSLGLEYRGLNSVSDSGNNSSGFMWDIGYQFSGFESLPWLSVGGSFGAINNPSFATDNQPETITDILSDNSSPVQVEEYRNVTINRSTEGLDNQPTVLASSSFSPQQLLFGRAVSLGLEGTIFGGASRGSITNNTLRSGEKMICMQSPEGDEDCTDSQSFSLPNNSSSNTVYGGVAGIDLEATIGLGPISLGVGHSTVWRSESLSDHPLSHGFKFSVGAQWGERQ